MNRAPDLVQCPANFSEGRRPEVVQAIAEAGPRGSHVRLVDVHVDPDHNRCVITWLGSADGIQQVALAAAERAVALIDLRQHAGAHPRIGALDVLPFVPFGETPLQKCVELAHATGRRLAESLGLPVFFYEAAALREDRRLLARIRRGGLEEMAEARLQGEGAPDAGPEALHPTAGAVAVGARGPLVAFNVELPGASVDQARRLAARMRESGGGLPGVRALGLHLPSRGLAQLSMNITRPAETSLLAVITAARRHASDLGLELGPSELVGTARLAELLPPAAQALGLPRIEPAQVLDLTAAELAGFAEAAGACE